MKVINCTRLMLNLKKRLCMVMHYYKEYKSLKETQYLLSGKNRDVLLESLKQAKSVDTVKNNPLHSTDH